MKDHFFENYFVYKIVIHGLFLVLPIGFSILWISSKDGNIEPIVVLLLIVAGIVELITPYFDTKNIAYQARKIKVVR